MASPMLRLCGALFCFAISFGPQPVLAVAQPADPQAELRLLERTRDISTAEMLTRLDALNGRLLAAPAASRRAFLALESEALLESGRFDAAQLSIAELRTSAETVHEEGDQVRAHVLNARLAYMRGDTPAQYEAARLAVALANSLGNAALSAEAYDALGVALYKRSMFEDATRALDRALAEARSTRDPVLEGRVFASLARLNIELRDNRRALQYVRDAQRILAPLRQRWLLASVQISDSIVSGESADGNESYPSLVLAAQMSHTLGLRVIEQVALLNLSDWHLIHKAWNQAIDVSTRALKLSSDLSDQRITALAHVNLGQGLVGIGRINEGVNEIEQARAIFRRLGNHAGLAENLPELALAYEKAGRYHDALDALKEARAAHGIVDRDQRSMQVAALQEHFDAENRTREIERLRLENRVSSAEITHHRQRSLFLTMIAVILVLAVVIVAIFYRRAKVANIRLGAANSRLAYLAERDPLTGLFNRRAIRAWIESLPTPSVEAPIGFALLDIDHFKSINDRFGHDAGDDVIVEIGHRLSSLLREGDRLARWGGEEFLVVAQGIAPRDMAGFAARILASIGTEPFILAQGPIKVSVSLGFCPFPLARDALAEGWETHFMLADQAMFYAKAQGRRGACGMVALHAPWKMARQASARDFAAALDAGLIEAIHWYGPESDPASVIEIGHRTPAA